MFCLGKSTTSWAIPELVARRAAHCVKLCLFLTVALSPALSLSAGTYRSRSRRDTAHPLALDAELAQKEIQREFGLGACILEEPCRVHASRAGSQRRVVNDGKAAAHAPWAEVLR